MIGTGSDDINSDINITDAAVGAVHVAHGLRIRSDLPLHGLPEVAGGGAAPDLRLRRRAAGAVAAELPAGELLLHLTVGGVTRYAAAFDGDAYVLRFPGCCEFTVDADLREVRCRRDPAAAPELMSILAAGALTAFVLTVAGATVLHASAVEVDGAAVGVVGASGFGKSTVAALLCAGGCPLVSDDVLRVEVGGAADMGGVRAHAGASELRLRPTVRALVDSFTGAATTRATADGRLALRPPRTALGRLPLAALAIPRAVDPGAPVTARRLRRPQALVELLGFPRLLGWTSTDLLRQQFEGLAALVEHVPVLELRVPTGPPFGADLGRQVRHALVAALRSDHMAATGSR